MNKQIRQSAPDSISRFVEQSRAQGKAPTDAAAGVVLAGVALFCVKAIPQQARQLVQRLKNTRLPVAKRCAVASVLAYLVQPHDMIPDSAPGGYGYLDDAIFLRAGLVQYLDLFPSAGSTAEQESSVVGLLISMTPPAIRAQFPIALNAMGSTIQLFNFVGPAYAEASLAQLTADPLHLQPPVAPMGFRPSASRDFERGFWGKGGAYIEGNNIVMPGGPALINGELFIP
jgi:uncharacterized membrane protein YkvA (DUF1232 family)